MLLVWDLTILNYFFAENKNTSYGLSTTISANLVIEKIL